MKVRSLILSGWALACVLMPLLANSAPVDRPLLSTLSQAPQWLTLLGYSDRQSSDVLQDEFFLAESGRYDPAAELQAALTAFERESEVLTGDALCRFPARFLWLQKQGVISGNPDLRALCPEYAEYLQDQHAESVSIVFASGYLGNPASYYGHLLVRVNSALGKKPLEDMAANYGAAIPPGDNLLVYITKGIFGGYESRFMFKKYYYFLHTYSDDENRDFWEYTLNLSPEETSLVLAHLWELREFTHNYFFLDKNCASRVAELLDLVTDERLSRDDVLWEIPQSVLQRMTDARVGGQPLIRTVQYQPSRQHQFQSRYFSLPSESRKYVNRMVEDPSEMHSDAFQGQDDSLKTGVVDTLLDYYRYSLPPESLGTSPEYRTALAERYRLPVAAAGYKEIKPQPPEQGRKPSYISAGLSHDQRNDTGLMLRLRPAYYDELDSSAGHIAGGALSMADVQIQVNKQGLVLDDLTLVDIRRPQSRNTELPGDEDFAWSLHAGFTRPVGDCDACLSSDFSVARGVSRWWLDERLVMTASIKGGYYDTELHWAGIFAGPELSARLIASPSWSVSSEILQRYFVDGRSRISGRATLRWATRDNQDLRLQISHDRESAFELSVGQYF